MKVTWKEMIFNKIKYDLSEKMLFNGKEKSKWWKNKQTKKNAEGEVFSSNHR